MRGLALGFGFGCFQSQTVVVSHYYHFSKSRRKALPPHIVAVDECYIPSSISMRGGVAFPFFTLRSRMLCFKRTSISLYQNSHLISSPPAPRLVRDLYCLLS